MVKYLFQTAWSLATTVIYRKPTRTDRLLDQPSYNPATSQKATTIWTLTRRAQLVCDSPDSLQDETGYLNNLFSKNNYNTGFVRRNTHSNTDSNTQTDVNAGPVTKATIPYIRGTSSETIARIRTLQYTCCTQTDNHFTTTAYLCQGQRQTGRQTGSSIQDQMLRLPRYLHW